MSKRAEALVSTLERQYGAHLSSLAGNLTIEAQQDIPEPLMAKLGELKAEVLPLLPPDYTHCATCGQDPDELEGQARESVYVIVDGEPVLRCGLHAGGQPREQEKANHKGRTDELRM